MASMTPLATENDEEALQDEIARLESRLAEAKARLRMPADDSLHSLPPDDFIHSTLPDHSIHSLHSIHSIHSILPASPSALHALLLLSDSALPLGSFAFSSGLESYLAHHKPSPPSASQRPVFHTFLPLSLSALATTALPYLLAAYRCPHTIDALDNDLDASTTCTVARRASIAQGRALLAVWDRSFQPYATPSPAAHALSAFSAAIRASDRLNAHLAPLWGLVTRALHLPLAHAAYLFLFSHARTLLSAAVRASVMGPYHAQALLASPHLQAALRRLVRESWSTPVDRAGQSVPVMDLWVARHEKLYSRIFNS